MNETEYSHGIIPANIRLDSYALSTRKYTGSTAPQTFGINLAYKGKAERIRFGLIPAGYLKLYAENYARPIRKR